MNLIKRKNKIRVRIPVARKPSSAIGTKKGKRGYNRKRDKRVVFEE